MNRKQAIVVGVVLLSTFIGGVFAAPNVPAIEQVFVTNFPSNQHVTVSNFPKTQNVTVTNPMATSQKTILIMDKQNITLAPCLSGTVCIPQFLATSPVNSSLGFREAFVYVHWDSVSPGQGLSGSAASVLINQKPISNFPGDSCITSLCAIGLPDNGSPASPMTKSGGPVEVTGEQFVFYLQPSTFTTQMFTNLTLSVFLEN